MGGVTNLIRLLTLLLCFGLLSSFSIMDKLKEHEDSKDLEARVIYLLNILRQIKKFSETKTNSQQRLNNLLDRDLKLTSQSTLQRSLSFMWDCTQNGGGFNKEQMTGKIDLQKKDYAILPPSSEWCRMMGFRACRQHS